MSNQDQRRKLAKRIARLEALRDGWKDGEGLAPTVEAIQAAKTLEASMSPVQANAYAGFASVEGGLSVEPLDPDGIYFEISSTGNVTQDKQED